jgi:hypothetical protein
VRLGENKISTRRDCDLPDDHETCSEDDPPIQDIPVDTVIPHESYDRRQKVNDIALIKLKFEARFRNIQNVGTICLPTLQSQKIENLEIPNEKAAKMIVAGWGTTEDSNRMSDDLFETIVPYVTNEKCEEKMLEIKRTHFVMNLELVDTHLVKTKTQRSTDDFDMNSYSAPVESTKVIHVRVIQVHL